MTSVITAQTVRRELRQLSRAREEEFQRTLTHFAIERLLYRLSRSSDAERFLLKGAMLFALWTGQLHRSTRDLDLAGRGDPTPEELGDLFHRLCVADVEFDGLLFDADSIQITAIREQQEYQGQRVRLTAYLEQARIPLQVDVGFGDAVTPGPEWADYPTLLPLAAPRLRVYPKETVVAEKLQAMVALGIINSRMKDFYDLRLLAQIAGFSGSELSQAIRATFQRRQTEMPLETPTAFSPAFFTDRSKLAQWQAFLQRNQLPSSDSLAAVIQALSTFLLPPLFAAAKSKPFEDTWPPGGPWQR